VDNLDELQLEDAIGSDVAQVQLTEQYSNSSDMPNILPINDPEESTLPLHYSFVLASSNDNSLNNTTKLVAFQKMDNSYLGYRIRF